MITIYSFTLFFKSMAKIFNYRLLTVIISAVLTFFNICKIEFLFSWICFVPLFICIITSNPKQSFKTGFLFGFIFSIFCFYWVIPGAEKFTGSSPIYGILVWLILATFFSIFYGLILYLFSFLKMKEDLQKALWLNSLLVASLFTLAEFNQKAQEQVAERVDPIRRRQLSP